MFNLFFSNAETGAQCREYKINLINLEEINE